MSDMMRIAQRSTANQIAALKAKEIRKLRKQQEAANYLELAKQTKNPYDAKYYRQKAREIMRDLE